MWTFSETIKRNHAIVEAEYELNLGARTHLSIENFRCAYLGAGVANLLVAKFHASVHAVAFFHNYFEHTVLLCLQVYLNQLVSRKAYDLLLLNQVQHNFIGERKSPPLLIVDEFLVDKVLRQIHVGTI